MEIPCTLNVLKMIRKKIAKQVSVEEKNVLMNTYIKIKT